MPHAYTTRLSFPDSKIVHKALVFVTAKEETFKTLCGKSGKYFPRWKSKKPVDCESCLKKMVQ